MRTRVGAGVGTVIVCGLLLRPAGGAAQVAVGVRGGLAKATVTIEDLDARTRRTGYTLGSYVRIGLGEVLAFDLGMAYTQKGVSGTDGPLDIALRIDYLEVPLLTTASLPLGDVLAVRLIAGPVLATEVGCETSIPQVRVSPPFDCDDPIFEGDLARKALDVGALAGAGLALVAGNGSRVGIDLTHEWGLRSIDEQPGPPTKNRAWLLTTWVEVEVGR